MYSNKMSNETFLLFSIFSMLLFSLAESFKNSDLNTTNSTLRNNVIIINGKKITQINKSLFNGYNISNLQRVNLANNKIKLIDNETFISFKKLEILELNMNQIKRLQINWTKGLENLKTLDLNTNKLDTLPQNIFKDLLRLEKLNLSNNNFHFTDTTNSPFLNLKKLKYLDLSNSNFLDSIGPNSFKDLNNLEIVWLVKSNIKSLSINAFKIPFCSSSTTTNKTVEIRMFNNPIVQTSRSNFKNNTCFIFLI